MSEKLITSNKRAYHDYFIEDKFEAGIVLVGTEVKSLRDGKANLSDAFMQIKNGEAFLHNLHISHYSFGNRQNHEPGRTRKLLLNKKEINKLFASIREDGYTVVPTRMYFKRGYVKVEIGLAKGKKLYDKRHDIKKKDSNKEMASALKNKNR